MFGLCSYQSAVKPVQAVTVSLGDSEHGAHRAPPCLQAPLGQSQAVGTGDVPVLLLFWASLGRAIPSSSRVWELPIPWALVERCWRGWLSCLAGVAGHEAAARQHCSGWDPLVLY